MSQKFRKGKTGWGRIHRGMGQKFRKGKIGMGSVSRGGISAGIRMITL